MTAAGTCPISSCSLALLAWRTPGTTTKDAFIPATSTRNLRGQISGARVEFTRAVKATRHDAGAAERVVPRHNEIAVARARDRRPRLSASRERVHLKLVRERSAVSCEDSSIDAASAAVVRPAIP